VEVKGKGVVESRSQGKIQGVLVDGVGCMKVNVPVLLVYQMEVGAVALVNGQHHCTGG